jgi:hypothetical protein
MRLYAPQSWPERAPDAKQAVYGVRNGEFVLLDANGCFVDKTAHVPAESMATVTGIAAGHRGGADGLGVAGAMAGALLGSAPVSGDAAASGATRFMDGDALTPLGSARPFDYSPGRLLDGDAFEIAKTPNFGEPGTWYTNPGSGQMRLYGPGGRPVVDLDFDHSHNGLRPHAHNWNGGKRDGGGDVVPFSPWNP